MVLIEASEVMVTAAGKGTRLFPLTGGMPKHVLSGKVRARAPGEQRGNGAWIGENARVHPGASLEGCVVVGENAEVGHDAVHAASLGNRGVDPARGA